MARGRKPFKNLPQSFMDEANVADTAKLYEFITQSALQIAELEEQLSQDEEVKRVRAELAELTASYRDALKVFKAKIRYCKNKLQEQGKL